MNIFYLFVCLGISIISFFIFEIINNNLYHTHNIYYYLENKRVRLPEFKESHTNKIRCISVIISLIPGFNVFMIVFCLFCVWIDEDYAIVFNTKRATFKNIKTWLNQDVKIKKI